MTYLLDRLRSSMRLLLAGACCAVSASALAHDPQVVRFASLDGTDLIGWLYRPVGNALPRGAVVALHGCGGLYATVGKRHGQINARHQAMADMLVQEGYAVLKPDSLTPRGVSQICTQKFSERKIDQRERRRDTLAAQAWLARQDWVDPKKIALLGWSNGGSGVLASTDANQAEVARQEHKFAVAIAFYPGCSAALKAGYQPNTRLLMLIGEKDDWTPAAPCVALGKTTGAEVTVYPDAYHEFDNPLGEVKVRTDIPNGVNPGRGVHSGPNPQAREQANARVREVLVEAFR